MANPMVYRAQSALRPNPLHDSFGRSLSVVTRRRILLIDEHPVILLGLSALFSREADLEVGAAAMTIHAARDQLAAQQFDLAVLDVGIGGVAGLDFIQELKLRQARAKILCFSVHEEAFYAERSLRAGANGYLMKSVDAPTLLRGVRAVLDGQICLSETMGGRILRRLAGASAGEQSPIGLLSNRELQIIHHIGESRDNRQIARLTGVSIKTIEAHRSRIKEKLNLRTTSDLIRFATHWVEREESFLDQTSAL